MTNEDLVRHARILRNDLAGELPNGVGNTIDALCDRAQSLSDRIDVLEGAVEHACDLLLQTPHIIQHEVDDLRASLTRDSK